jgi:hypothetical protein
VDGEIVFKKLRSAGNNPSLIAVSLIKILAEKDFIAASIADKRLRGDVHDNSCSHPQSLNCFARFGNRPNESDLAD